MNSKTRIVAAALVSLGLAASVVAATNPSTNTPNNSASTMSHRQRGPMMGMPGPFAGGGFMSALRQLNLTDQQKQSIKDITSKAREQFQPLLTDSDLTALANPGDPGYAQAVRDAQAAAAKRIEQFSATEQQIYNLLTPAQKTQLPKVLADMKTQRNERRADRGQKHGQNGTSPNKSVL